MAAHPGKPLNVGDLTQELSAEADNMLPRGEIGRRVVTSDTDGTDTVLVIASETVTVLAGREITVEAHGSLISAGPTGASVRLLQDGTQLDRKNFWIPNSGIDISYSIKVSARPTAGDHLYELMIGVSGTPNNRVRALCDGGGGVHGKTEMLITDVGQAY